MRRLVNVYPSDLVKWPNKRGVFAIGSSNENDRVLFYNETPLNIDIDFENGNTDVLHAWEANFWILDGDTTEIRWSIDADSLTTSNPPINAVFSTLYGADEPLNEKAYPMPLIRQLGIGGSVQTSSIQTLSNEGSANGTLIIDAGTTGINNLIQIFNDHFIWSVYQSGIAHQVLKGNTGGNPLQIGQNGDVSEILGTLLVDNNNWLQWKGTSGALKNILQLDNSDIMHMRSGVNGKIQFEDNVGVVNATIDTTNNITTFVENVVMNTTLTVSGTAAMNGIITAPAANILGTVGNLQHILGMLTVDQAQTFTGDSTHNGRVVPAFTGTTINGAIAGTCTCDTPVWGASLKILQISMTSFNNGPAVQFVFPSPMSRAFFAVGALSSLDFISFLNGVTGVSVNVITALGGTAAGASSSLSTVHGNSIGQITATIDRISFNCGGGDTTDIIVIGK